MSARLALLFAVTVALGASAWGCSFADGPIADLSGPTNGCSSDSDCGDDGSCDAELGMCVSDMSGTGYQVAFQYVPPPGSDAPSQVRVLEAGELDSVRDFRFDSILVRGAVLDRTGTVDEPHRILARVTFTPKLRVDGPESEPVPVWVPVPRVIATSKPEADFAPGDDGQTNFTVRLVPETDYDVTIQPLDQEGQRLPPFYGSFRSPSRSPGDTDELSFSHTYSEVFLLRGVLADEQGEPVADAQLRAVDLSGRLVSSTVRSAEDGAFELALPAEAVGGPYGFVFEVNVPNVAVFELPAPPLFEALPEPAAVLPVTLPHLGPSVLYTATVEPPMSAQGGEDEGVANVTVTFEALALESDPEVTTVVQRSVVSDGEGEIEVRLPPGEYRVALRPPSAVALAVTGVDSITVQPTGSVNAQQGQVFRLEQVRPYQGVVFDEQTLPVGGVPVSAVALGVPPVLPRTPEQVEAGEPEQLDYRAAFNRDADTQSRPDDDPEAPGLFELPLDRGLYDLSARPAPDSGFAWAVHPNLPVLETSAEVDLQLLPPVVVRGLAGLDDGTAALGGTVQALRATRDLAQDNGMRAVLIGRATIQADGSYRLLLPPRFNNE